MIFDSISIVVVILEVAMFLIFKTAAKPSNLELNFGFETELPNTTQGWPAMISCGAAGNLLIADNIHKTHGPPNINLYQS